GDNAPMAVIELVMEPYSPKQATVKEAEAATARAVKEADEAAAEDDSADDAAESAEDTADDADEAQEEATDEDAADSADEEAQEVTSHGGLLRVHAVPSPAACRGERNPKMRNTGRSTYAVAACPEKK